MKKIKIAIPTFNAESWILNNLQVLINQSYKNFEACIINDASTDNTGNILEDVRSKLDSRFLIIHNKSNLGALRNQVESWKKYLNCAEDLNSILTTIDGDDCLFSQASLHVLSQYYEKFNPLLTYGNHVHWPWGSKSNCEQLPNDVLKNNSFRDYKFCTSHLRTFLCKVLMQIPDSHLCDQNGEMYKVAGDVALMMPALELSNPRIVFIQEALYCYNRINPLSDDLIKQSEQSKIEREVRLKPRLNSLQ